ncbi:DUF3006 domain-containing protein [Haloarchaeobius sp. HRN-SO-5]|uniref:DUF3006 domain-containing protein n=1 Tax=Haloarchaeobius sp. HRN-SO-5 TaxID=3446118 RepID=UPI003EB94050
MIRRYTAVLDRFEEDTAVLLLEEDGVQVDELLLDRHELPEAGRRQNAVFDVRVCGDSLRILTYRPEETDRRTTDAQDRFDRLASDLPTADESDQEESTDSTE